MTELLKPCPFCGGYLRITARIVFPYKEHVDAVCCGCRMVFSYEQEFAFSKDARVALTPSFVDLWDGREDHVVHCKDCKHLYGGKFCAFSVVHCKPDGFCSHGERKE